MPDLIDYTFIAEREGSLKLNGYVPAAGQSRSGVTIATGFDLGQRSRADLTALSLPLTLIDTLVPYLGVISRDAENLLKDAPLRITLLDAIIIDRAFKQKFGAELATSYDGAATTRNTSHSFRSQPRRKPSLPPSRSTTATSAAGHPDSGKRCVGRIGRSPKKSSGTSATHIRLVEASRPISCQRSPGTLRSTPNDQSRLLRGRDRARDVCMRIR